MANLNEVKFLKGSWSNLINKTPLDANTIYASTDGALIGIGGKKYYGEPYLEYADGHIKLYGIATEAGDGTKSPVAESLLSEVGLTLPSLVETAKYITSGDVTVETTGDVTTYKATIGKYDISIEESEYNQLPALAFVLHTETGTEDGEKTITLVPVSDFVDNFKVEVDNFSIKTAPSSGTNFTNPEHNVAGGQIYAADAIIENDFKVLGGNVGQLTSGTLISGGTSVIELLKKMLVKVADCSKVNPTCTLGSLGVTDTQEVGTKVSFTLSSTYVDGKFTGSSANYGYNYSVDAGCEQGDVTYKQGTTVLASTTISDYALTEGTTSWSCTSDYAASTVTPKKNNGEDSTQKISSGTTSESTQSITAKYKYYYGSTTADTVNDVTINGLTTGWTEVGTTTTIKGSSKYSLPTGYFVIMCQEGYKLSSIQDYTFGTSYVDNFKVTGTKTVTIGGDSNATYNVYIWVKAPDSQPDVKNITLAKNV